MCREKFETNKQAKANVKTAICAVAELLGNTPAICRKCYVHPAIVEAYLSGRQIAGLADAMQNTGNINVRAVERAIFKFLRASKRGEQMRVNLEVSRRILCCGFLVRLMAPRCPES